MHQLQSPEIQAFTAGYFNVLLHTAVTLVILFAGSLIYVLLTPHREIALIREGNAAAGVSLGGVVLGLGGPRQQGGHRTGEQARRQAGGPE